MDDVAIVLKKSLRVDVGGSEIKEVQLTFRRIVCKVGRIRVTLHYPHLEDLTESQLENESTNFVPDCLRHITLFKASHCETF